MVQTLWIGIVGCVVSLTAGLACASKQAWSAAPPGSEPLAAEKERPGGRVETMTTDGPVVSDLPGPCDDVLRSTVNIKANRHKVRAILQGLSAKSGLSVIIDDDVNETITLSLREVTIRQAIFNIVRAAGLRSHLDGCVLRVMASSSDENDY